MVIAIVVGSFVNVSSCGCGLHYLKCKVSKKCKILSQPNRTVPVLTGTILHMSSYTIIISQIPPKFDASVTFSISIDNSMKSFTLKNKSLLLICLNI